MSFVHGHFGRIATSITVLLLLAWIALQIVSNTAADNISRTDPAEALVWRADSAGALVGLAEEQLRASSVSDEDLSRISELARRALLANPLESRALRVLALVVDIQGKTGDADALMRAVANRTRRDSGAELWLFDQRARERNFAEALARADVILRTRPAATSELFPSLVAITRDPEGETAMVEALSLDPPWRSWFLRQLPQTDLGPSIAYALFTRLSAADQVVRSTEIGPYLNALIQTGEVELAFLAWLRSLPPERSMSVPFVYNGDFELPVSGLPFDWAISQVPGAVTDVVKGPDNDNALRVVFSDRRVAYRHVSKLLLLPPGSYELSGTVSAEALITARGMRWRIECAEADHQQLVVTDDFAGTFSGRRFTVSLVVPASGCRAQTLRLELDARVALEQQAVGTFWTDDLAVERAAPATTGALP